jgi:tetratricopeptide (TPR) repeat protein
MSTVIAFYAPSATTDYAAALARIAQRLAVDGQRILMVDWNLRYPSKRGLTSPEDATKPGLFDLLLNYAEEKPEIEWRELLLHFDSSKAALLPSGLTEGTNRTISWKSFYGGHKGGNYLERLRDEWTAAFEIVLIFCPAGDDEEGVCTVQMADVLVLPFTLDSITLTDTANAVQRRNEARQHLAYDRMPLQVVPIPVVTGVSRLVESTLLQEAAIRLAFCFRDWLPGNRSPREALELLRINAETGRNEQGWQRVFHLIQGNFRNTTTLFPPHKAAGPSSSKGAFEELAGAPLSLILEAEFPKLESSLPVVWEAWAGHQRRLRKERILESSIHLLGKEHPDTRAALRDLVSTLKTLGDYRGANQHAERLYEITRRILGEDHPDTLLSLDDLAETLRALGDYHRARQYEEQVLTMRRQALGEEHPHTVSAMGNLAATLHAQGDYHSARHYEEKVLDVRRRILGEEHPDTLKAMGNLATTLRALGDYQAARNHAVRVLTGRRRLLGEEHPETILALGNLATTLHMQGVHQTALGHTKEVVALSSKILGEEHPQTLSAIGNLAAILYTLGQYTSARWHEDQLLAARRRVLGEEHPQTLSTLGNLAVTLHALGDYRNAKRYGEQALEARRRVLGEEHPQTLSAMSNLAVTFHALGDYRSARRYGEHVLEARRRVLGEEHPDTLSALNDLVEILNALGDYPLALQHKKKFLEMHRRMTDRN